MNLFSELEEQLTLAIANLKRLNEVIGTATEALESATIGAHEVTNLTQETVEEKPVAKKKRASRKKAPKKVLEEQPALQVTTDPDLISNEQLFDPLGNPINQNIEQEPTPLDDVMSIDEVRKRIQAVALQLNGDTAKIGQYMNNRFGKAKLSDFAPAEYAELVTGAEALVPSEDPSNFDPLG